jgi:MYXO-CTERM domain-containing protein
MHYVQGDLDLRSSRSIAARAHLGVGLAALIVGVSLAGTASAKPFEDYLKPTPTVCPLTSNSWGCGGTGPTCAGAQANALPVLPRDTCNGIESTTVPPAYYYWDGQIIKAKDGKYHMFHSTWAGSTGFQNWGNSDAFHAISEQGVLGPYKRQDYVYPSHRGHNVSAAELPDGSYVVIVSEIVQFTIYKSSSLDGPWTPCQPTHPFGGVGSNISFVARHDGKFEITERSGGLAIADTLCGNYVRQKPTCTYPTADGNSVYPKRTSTPGVPNPTYNWQEDPHIWRSGGTYHIIYSGSGDRVGWHVYSPDGITGWKDNGYAWSPRDYQKLFCYEGSTTCTQWYKMERPSVVLEDGHPTHVTWAVADVDKDNQIPAGSNHGSKVIVVPFDGVAFDQDFGTGGGDAGAGGATGTGGTTGAGGGSGRGGAGGSSSGGAGGSASGTGTGGATGGGGATSAGGATGTGGATSAGGATGTGGATGAGGATSAGGATGGNGGAGGTTSGNAGGLPASGGRASGGATVNSGGSAGHGGGNSGSAGTSSTPGGSSASGCACTMQGRKQASGIGSLLLLGLALLPLVRRRRSAKTV